MVYHPHNLLNSFKFFGGGILAMAAACDLRISCLTLERSGIGTCLGVRGFAPGFSLIVYSSFL